MKSFLYIIFVCLLAGPISSFGQNVQPKPPADQIQQTFMPTPGQPVGPAVFANPLNDINSINWDINLLHKSGIRHAIDQEDEKQVMKAQKTAAKIAMEKAGAKPTAASSDQEAAIGFKPIVLSTFEDNGGTGIPPDNNMAISDDGYIVSVYNTSISYLDTDGNATLTGYPFSNLVPLQVSNFMFDPKILYDPVEDKFILVLLSGNTPATSNVVVGFSNSQNPADGWNFYSFDGDYLAGNWFDYPTIGISANDLVIGGNLFNNNDQFQQAVILQIDKSDGFDGVDDPEWEYFNNVSDGSGSSAFTIVPASYGYDGEYGPGIFMVSNRSFQGNQIWLYEITDAVGQDQMINVYTIATPVYSAPGDGLMLGTTDEVLNTNDCRIQNAYYANGKVVFGYTLDYLSGYAGIRVNRLDVAALSNQLTSYGILQNEAAFPTVVPFGMDETSNSVMLAYLQTSSAIYPQVAVVNLGEDNVFGPATVVKAGESFINSIGGDDPQRWGDYTGGGRRHNSTYPNAWFSGCFGQSSDYGTWIFEVSDEANGLAPAVEFEGSPKSGEIELPVLFNDLSQNGVEDYVWTFEGGNPATSTESNPTVNYDTPGKYDVTLEVSNAFGSATMTKEEYITASQSPIAAYEADVTEGPAPLTVNFTNLSIYAESFTWALPGGDPGSSTEENPTTVYNVPGTYNVALTVENPSGTDTDVKFGYITVGPVSVNDKENQIGDVKVYPNPISSVFTLEFFIPKKTEIDISIFDATGKNVKTLLHGRAKGGVNKLSFNKNALSAGMYLLVIKDDQQNVIKNEKIIISQ